MAPGFARVIETVFVPRGAEEKAVRRGLARARADVRVYTTGIGPHAAALAAEEALAEAAFGTALVTGFCGALSPAFAVGDALVYANIARDGEAPVELERELAALVASRIPGAQSGVRAVASDAIVGTAREKRALAARSDAGAVDMESRALTERLQRAGVSVSVVRVASDAAGDDLPDLDRAVDAAGGIDAFALLLAMARRPRAALRLARNGARALAALQAALFALFR